MATSESVKRAWETRRERYGASGTARQGNSEGAKKAWITRRQRFGESGFSSGAKDRIRAAVRDLAAQRTHCQKGHPYTGAVDKRGAKICEICKQASRDKYNARVQAGLHTAKPAKSTCSKGHPYTGETDANGFQVCVVCREQRKTGQYRREQRNRRLAKLGALIPAGDPRGLKRGEAVKRDKYGPSLMSPEALEVARQRLIARNKARKGQRATHCRRGHPYSYTKNGKRFCAPCRWLTRGTRPKFILKDGVKFFVTLHDQLYRKEYTRLFQEKVAAHPDKGGTHRKFLRATKKLEYFLWREGQWYRALKLVPPDMKGWKDRRRIRQRDLEEAVR